MEKEPFPELKIDSASFLDDLDTRSKCTKCEKSRKFYCYTCYLPVPEISDRVPSVKLPLKVDIIKHPSEVDGKSTAVHAGVLAPDDVTIFTYPCIPDYDKDKVAVVFPCNTSKTLEQLYRMWNKLENEDIINDKANGSNERKRATTHGVPADSSEEPRTAKMQKVEHTDGGTNIETPNDSSCNLLEGTEVTSNMDTTDLNVQSSEHISDRQKPKCPLERVIFIDSTWNQTRSICNDERLRGLQCVELKSEKTKFWRHQKDIPDTYLSTIEAIYYFLREFHENFITDPYTSQYDNLLFFFRFMYMKIRNIYNGGDELKAYKNRKERTVKNTE